MIGCTTAAPEHERQTMLHPGLTLSGRYRLVSRIGSGGMGEVWQAVDEVLGRTIAVKAMLPAVAGDADVARRFLIEAKAMASVNHPAVASIHDYGTSDSVTFLVMEFIDGESLAATIARSGPLAPEHAMHLVAQAAEGLQAVHDLGIVNRDIKPANLLIRRNGSVLITDFGISQILDAASLTASGAILGTPTYLSPEQVTGQPTTALSDVYSLGLVAYECLSGERPFVGDNPYAVALQRVRSAPPTIGVDVPPLVLTVLERAMATDPADRWPSAASLAEAARAVASGRPPHDGRTPTPPRGLGSAPQPGRKRSRWGRRVAIASLSLVAVLVVVYLVGWALTLGFITALPNSVDGPGIPVQGSVSAPAPAPTLSESAMRQAGLVRCNTAYCPAKPQCWGGLSSINGRAAPPRQIPCTRSHVWETFLVGTLAADAIGLPPGDLLGRDDIADLCSQPAMGARSYDPDTTAGWRRAAWPVRLANGGWGVHCLAQPKVGGERSGVAFTTP